MKKVVLWEGSFQVSDSPSDTTLIKQRIAYFFIYSISNKYSWFPEFRNVKDSCPDKNDINLYVIPCESIDEVIFNLKNIDTFLLEWCKTNCVKIIFSISREYIFGNKLDEIISLLKPLNQYLHLLKIFINSYDNMFYENYKNVFVTLNTFDYILNNHVEGSLAISNIEKKYKFSLFTGTLNLRRHRALFLLDLIKANLLDSIFYTIICPESVEVTQKFLSSLVCNQDLKLLLNLNLDTCVDKNGKKMNSKKIYSSLQEWYAPIQMHESYINIALETLDNYPSITEKIYKPIMYGVPFVWLACNGVANELKKQGYMLYPFINYSYDTIRCPIQRRRALVNELIRLSNLDLAKEIVACSHIITYNMQTFIENTKTNKVDEFLTKI